MALRALTRSDMGTCEDAIMKCPMCRRWNASSVTTCECGYDIGHLRGLKSRTGSAGVSVGRILGFAASVGLGLAALGRVVLTVRRTEQLNSVYSTGMLVGALIWPAIAIGLYVSMNAGTRNKVHSVLRWLLALGLALIGLVLHREDTRNVSIGLLLFLFGVGIAVIPHLLKRRGPHGGTGGS